MRNIKKCFCIWLAVVISTLILTACPAVVVKYMSKYALTKCTDVLTEHNNISNEIVFDRKYIHQGTTIFFDEILNDDLLIDTWIEKLIIFSHMLEEKNINGKYNIHISNRLIPNVWKGDNGVKNISFTSNLTEEEAFAWILQIEFDHNFDLPYGIFAGVSAYWLNKTAFSRFVITSIANANILTELQFPLYEKNNLSENQRTYAWSYSYRLVKDWIDLGNSEIQLMTLDKAEIESYLHNKYEITLPNYRFLPYSTQYEYMVEQGCFTYYINKDYNDLILPSSSFSTSYSYLSDWLKDNAQTTDISNKIFGIRGMYYINVYLDDGLKSTGISGEAYGQNIVIYSVGSFSHEYIHHVLIKNGRNGYLKEVIPELHANTSKYANLMWYYLLSGEAAKFPYEQKVNEKDSYKEAMGLYNQVSGIPATPSNFNFWLFADCFSAMNTKMGQQFVSRLQPDSLSNFIARNYGAEYLWQINAGKDVTINGKTYAEMCNEWVEYLSTIKN